MVPGERPMIPIGYKCSSRNILSFFATARAGITTLGITYLSNYPEKKINFLIFPIACLHIIYIYFCLVHEVDSHINSWQSDLALENFWVTQCGWIQLCTTIAMSMKITKYC